MKKMFIYSSCLLSVLLFPSLYSEEDYSVYLEKLEVVKAQGGGVGYREAAIHYELLSDILSKRAESEKEHSAFAARLLNKISDNYSDMAEEKLDAAEAHEKKRSFDWSDYSELQADNQRMELKLRKRGVFFDSQAELKKILSAYKKDKIKQKKKALMRKKRTSKGRSSSSNFADPKQSKLLHKSTKKDDNKDGWNDI